MEEVVHSEFFISGLATIVPMNFLRDALNEPRFNAMVLPKPPIVLPVDSLKLDGINPNLTMVARDR